jgi:20S proteasome alpha/beta subunit
VVKTYSINFFAQNAEALMTLAVAIKAADSVVMAADSRGTIGDPRGLTAINDTQVKLFQFGNCGIVLAGASEMALAILDEFSKQGLNNPTNVDDAVAAFAQAAIWCDTWYRGITPDKRPGAMFILAGYRQNPAGPAVALVYLLNSQTSFAPQLCSNYPMMIGVPQYAIYLSHRYYDPAISADSATALAEYLISETASQDPKVGGPIRIAKVSAVGYQALTDAQVQALHRQNERLNKRLKRFFTA